MTREEVIARICRLQSLVSQDLFAYEYAADCVCDDRAHREYRNDGRSIKFIESAVRAALVEAGARRLTRRAREKRHAALEASARLGQEMVELMKRSRRELP